MQAVNLNSGLEMPILGFGLFQIFYHESERNRNERRDR